MAKIIYQSPGRYVQGKGVIESIADETQRLGSHALIISDEVVWNITKDQIDQSFSNNSEVNYDYETFKGESSENEINRIVDEAKTKGIDVVIGLGGGKALDTGKAVANALNASVIDFASTASMDAPTAAVSVIYDDNGVFSGYEFYPKNPDTVMVDSQIVAQAPVRLFASGMSDGLATLVEVESTLCRQGKNMFSGKPSLASLAIAQKCEEVIFEYGHSAYEAIKNHIVSPQVEAVIEANTLLSGLGFENGGLAAAHAIHNGFTALEGDIHHLTHGEKVAYGILVQLVLENAPTEKFVKYQQFLSSIHMPTTLEELHIADKSYEDLVRVGERALEPNDTFANLSDKLNADDIADAILTVSELSKSTLNSKG
ncbi:glycerol dehydrogenase [Staphylococcus hominis]|uniref:glycerol dehydrogenase n=1 Tax=Staphylococcus hominis TaxID=1290 RepID=UPI000C260C97|nr:glycerol dehydrogenase [Staphylococcus hominis]PJM33187.1 glycerol dehydrogenase [Staphylococcus hominis]PJM56547.1 glycerol dehydrogenase [Staphylococcus hominis]